MARIGHVTPQQMPFERAAAAEERRALADYTLVYETYGTLNADTSNAVLVCHALNASHHVAGTYAGQDKERRLVGQPRRARASRWTPTASSSSASTTSGSCFGSTGPMHVNPATGRL